MVDADESRHGAASQIWHQLAVEGGHTFTTNFVVAEAHALLLVRLGYHYATHFLRHFEASATTVVRVSFADEQRARQIIYQSRDKRFSLTDATCFAIMERLRIGTVFTFDHNFAQFGFTLAEPHR
jgi:predicted nucleic acid-binding protein